MGGSTAIHCTCGPPDDAWDCALHDEELPGMWEHADFTGGRDEVRGPDWTPSENGSEPPSSTNPHDICFCGGPLNQHGICEDRCARDSYEHD